jgi:hypothetical protein
MKKYIPEEVLTEVLKVLEFGDIKHPGENWKTQTEALHLAHTMEHINHYLFIGKTDIETGRNHLAHAICRLLFAMGTKK